MNMRIPFAEYPATLFRASRLGRGHLLRADGRHGVWRPRAQSVRVTLGVLAWVACLYCEPEIRAGQLHGRVTDSEDGTWLEGARVELDRQIDGVGDGVPDYTTEADLFGFYRIRDVTPGDYDVTATLRGYDPAADTLAIAGTAGQEYSLSLVRHPGAVLFPLWFQVNCVKTGMPLQGMTVKVRRVSQVSGELQEEFTATTDDAGHVELLDMQSGSYDLQINPTGDGHIAGWESYETAERAQLGQAHLVNVQLKPVSQTVEATVIGFDPVTELENSRLGQITVEATALAPDGNDSLQLLPTLSAGSRSAAFTGDDAAGKAWFYDLCPADWRFRGKRLGYEMREEFVRVNSATGMLENNAVELNMDLHATELIVVLNMPEYYPVTAFAGTTVHLEGTKDTNTEGISRDVEAGVFELDRQVAMATFTRILPGSYEISFRETISHTVLVTSNEWDELTRTWEGEFVGSLFAEAVDDQTSTVEMLLTPTPVQAAFTLRVAERVLDFCEPMAGNLRYPAREFVPRANQVVKVVMSDYMLPEQTRAELPEYTGTTDENGRFSVTVPPGLYGVRIDDMPDHWGMQIRKGTRPVDVDDGVWEGDEWEQPWPYAGRWPHSLDRLQQYPNEYFFGAGGMALDSGQEYNVTLQVGSKTMPYLFYDLYDYTTSPFIAIAIGLESSSEVVRNDYFLSLMTGPGSVTLASQEGRGSYTSPVDLNRDGGLKVEFRDLPPGRYQVSVNHPDLILAPGFSHNDVVIFDCPPPGHIPDKELPDCEEDGVDVRYPFDYWQRDDLYLGYANAQTYEDLKVMEWDAEQGIYTNAGYNGTFNLLQSPDFGDLWFVVNREGQRLYLPTDREYSLYVCASVGEGGSVWLQMAGANLKLLEGVPTLYFGGPQANCATVAQPQVTHTFYLQAFSNDSVPEEISGVTVTFWDDRSLVTPTTIVNTLLEPSIRTASHPNWLYDNRKTVTQSLATDAIEVRARVYMRRGLRLRVEVLNALTDQSLAGAKLTTRYANHVDVLTNPVAPLDGWTHIFDFEQPFDASENILLSVRADGYIPRVIELSPSAAIIDPDNPKQRAYILTDGQAVKLTPLPGPELVETNLDRSGGFLPGVKKAGGTDGYDPDAVKSALTLTWSFKAKPRTHEFPGDTPADPSRQVLDDIAEVWLIDQRYFTKSFYNDDSSALLVPVNNGTRTPGTPYSLNQPEMGWTYLRRGVLAENRKVIYQRVRDLAPAADGSIEIARTLYLPEMPPGQFQPVAVAVSRLGALTVYEFDYTGDAEPTQLVGSRLPPWMGMLANVFGTVAGTQAQAKDAGLERFLPEGFLSPLPEFTATIAAEEGYLKYDYGLSITMSEGSDTPGEGLLGMAQAVMGLELEAGLQAGFDGRDREYSLGVSGSLGKESLDPNDYCPWIADFVGVKPSLDPGPKGTLTTEFSESFVGDNIPHQKRVRHSLSGQTGMKLTVDLTSSLNAIPYVGPVIRKVGKYADIGCDASMSGLTGLKVTREWETTYPERQEIGTPYVGDKPARRHFLGGSEKDITNTTFELAFNFGVGLEVSASERAGASGKIELTGEEGWTGQPALAITSNPVGQWPVIKRIDGKVQLSLEAHLDYWIDTYEKEWTWDLIDIKHEYGTETGFQLVPVTVLATQSGRDDLEPAEALGTSPQILRGVMADASLHTAGAGFVFIDMDSPGGNQLLRIGRRESAVSYQLPVAVTGSSTNGAILATAMVQLSAGGWLIVWSVIDEADLDNPLAPAHVQAVTVSDDLTEFGGIENVADCDLPVTSITTVQMGTDIACALSLAKDGPDSQRYRLLGVLRNTVSAQWGPTQLLAEEIELLALTGIGTADAVQTPAHIAVITTAHGLWSMTWNGTAAGVLTPVAADESCGRALCGVAIPDGQWLLASRAGSGMRVFRHDAGEWTQVSEPLSDNHVAELAAVAIADPTGFFIAWTTGGGTSTICYTTLNEAGQPISTVMPLTQNPKGIYKCIAVSEALDGFFTIASVYENDTVREFRSFDVDKSTLLIAHDDRDGDDMQDHLELEAVDDNPEDAFQIIDQILPEDDYDGDGELNHNEYGMAEGETPTTIMQLWVDTGSGNSTALEFGEVSGADNDFDTWDTVAEPESGGEFPACFLNNNASNPQQRFLAHDIRPPADTTRWRLFIPASVTRNVTTLTWSVAEATGNREVFLQQLKDEEPVGFPVDMRNSSTLEIGGKNESEFEIVYSLPVDPDQEKLVLESGWNLVGNPVMSMHSVREILDNGSGSPVNRGSLWYWRDGQYIVRDEAMALSPELGYWIYCDTAGNSMPIPGIRADGRLLVRPGWNLISPVTDCLMPEAAGLALPGWYWDISSKIYCAVTSGQTLQAGKGYWLFVISDEPILLDPVPLGTTP